MIVKDLSYQKNVFIKLERIVVAGEIAQRLKVPAALPEVPMSPSGLCGHLYTTGHTLTQTHTHKQETSKYLKESQKKMTCPWDKPSKYTKVVQAENYRIPTVKHRNHIHVPRKSEILATEGNLILLDA